MKYSEFETAYPVEFSLEVQAAHRRSLQKEGI